MEALVLLREPMEIAIGLDIVDSRSGKVLAWAPNYTAIPLAEYLNTLYPIAEFAPNHEQLKLEIPRHLNEMNS